MIPLLSSVNIQVSYPLLYKLYLLINNIYYIGLTDAFLIVFIFLKFEYICINVGSYHLVINYKSELI